MAHPVCLRQETTGDEVWRSTTLLQTNGNPMTYRAGSGWQFVVIATDKGADAALVAFARPRSSQLLPRVAGGRFSGGCCGYRRPCSPQSRCASAWHKAEQHDHRHHGRLRQKSVPIAMMPLNKIAVSLDQFPVSCSLLNPWKLQGY